MFGALADFGRAGSQRPGGNAAVIADPGTDPTDTYITEDGALYFVTEDGASYFAQE